MRPANLLFLAGFAAALPKGTSVSKTVNGRAAEVTAADLANFKYFGEHAAATFCNYEASPGALVKCSSDACNGLMANGAKIVVTLNHNTSTNIAGYIATDDVRKVIVLAFRGSVTLRNWMADFNVGFVPCSYGRGGCQIHSGFDKGWSQVRDQVLPALVAAKKSTGYRIVPGNEYRLTHENDAVPRLPPLFFGYRHTSTEYWLNGGDSVSFQYGLQNIKVCQGNANLGCIGSVVGFAPEAHKYYLQLMNGCRAPGISIRDETSSAAAGSDVSDEELNRRLEMWAAMDREYLAMLHANGTAA
ncbi:hypothetical protein MAPG_03867 [Magnaporthiopsis poae ATCC 64411]|uniref:Fungal lipase-type domain-containing protein n=1 Tax=Magnaporthiopsis poae (strain ATCC 64411 / 73-15) TaxID=644358 RepID=A0A0C4DV66_MAGP6|nr:hypothetical protein MAPG_03867 [Magnaporthiopsis poae ATCC 64411]